LVELRSWENELLKEAEAKVEHSAKLSLLNTNQSILEHDSPKLNAKK
jgi:hypothetical protein